MAPKKKVQAGSVSNAPIPPEPRQGANAGFLVEVEKSVQVIQETFPGIERAEALSIIGNKAKSGYEAALLCSLSVVSAH